MITVLDIALLLIIAVLAIRCALRGFIAEVLSMAAIIFGIVAAVMLSKAGALLIDQYAAYSQWNEVIAFLVIFLLVYLAVKLVQSVLHSVFERIHLDRLDRALGFFLGLGEGLLAVMVIVYLLKVQPIFDVDQLLSDSYVARLALEIIPLASPELGRGLESSGV